MAYDEDLADRIRELIDGEAGWTEQRMFGGLAFMIHRHLAIAASGQGGLLVRADPAKADGLVARSSATPAVMGGREMAGWLRVESDDVRTKHQLTRWFGVGRDYASSLPPKTAPGRTR